jgi:coenzyme F420-reducing hydrogenase gamma subunit
MSDSRRVKLAVFKFSSCDGCQLQILNAEDELLKLAENVDISYFMEATRKASPGPYDVSLVEGSVSTPEEEDRIKQIRRDSKFLIAIGACATAGGIQALRNWSDVEYFKRVVYPNPEWISALKTATPISAHVKVDLELMGCPISKDQLISVIAQLLRGKRPYLPTYSVCVECKARGTPCVVVTKNIPCLGPITMAGCGAICPAYGRGCYGCFGPMDDPNPKALIEYLVSQGIEKEKVLGLLRMFTGYSEKFRKAVDEYE